MLLLSGLVADVCKPYQIFEIYELLMYLKLHILDMQSFMRNLSELSRGQFHCYTSSDEEQIYTGDDISRLL